MTDSRHRCDAEEDYERLRDAIVDLLNPPDDDADEPSICEDALRNAVAYIEAQACTCVNTAPDGEDGTVPWDHRDKCRRCDVLGRYYDEPISR